MCIRTFKKGCRALTFRYSISKGKDLENCCSFQELEASPIYFMLLGDGAAACYEHALYLLHDAVIAFHIFPLNCTLNWLREMLAQPTCSQYRYSGFLSFQVIKFYKVATNSKLTNTKSLLLGEIQS